MSLQSDRLAMTGPAALVDLCFVPIAQGAGAGWQPVPKLAQPVPLPVQDPNYPARQGPADLAGDASPETATLDIPWPSR